MFLGMLLGALLCAAVFHLLLLFLGLYGRRALEPREQGGAAKKFPAVTLGGGVLGGTPEVVEAKVQWTGRGQADPKVQKNAYACVPCSVLFYLLLATQLLLVLLLVASANSALIPEGDCPDGTSPLFPGKAVNYCVSDRVKEQHDECCEATAATSIAAISGDDSCTFSKDGVCDEPTYCPTGTDSTDCGNSGGVVTRHWCVHGSDRRLAQQGHTLVLQGEAGVQGEVQLDMWAALAMAQGGAARKARRLRPCDAGRCPDVKDEATCVKTNGLVPWESCVWDAAGGRCHDPKDCGDLDDPNASMWDAFAEFVQVPAGMLAAILGLVPVWLLLLNQFPAGCVWATIAINLAGTFYIFYLLQWFWPVLVYMVVQVACLVIFRKQIYTAIATLRIATSGLAENPSVFRANFVAFLMYLCYLGAWMAGILSSAGVLEVHPTTCKPGQPAWVGSARNFLMMMIVLTTFFFNTVRMSICGAGLGAWYFHGDDPAKPRSPAFVGLRWAFLESSGPTFAAAVVQYIVHEIREWATMNLCWYCVLFPLIPFLLVLKCVWCCIETTVRCFCTYMMLGHVFHGSDLIGTARKAFVVLRKHLGDAVVTDLVAKRVTETATDLLSVGLGFAGWYWMDTTVKVGILEDILGAETSSMGTQLLFLSLAWLLFVCSRHPLFSLVVVIGFLQPFFTQCDESNGGGFCFGNDAIGLFVGIFVSVICSIVFRFVGGIVHNSMHTILYCLALELETGEKQERFAPMYAELKAVAIVVQGTPVLACGHCQAPWQPGAKFCAACGAQAAPVEGPVVTGQMVDWPEK